MTYGQHPYSAPLPGQQPDSSANCQPTIPQPPAPGQAYPGSMPPPPANWPGVTTQLPTDQPIPHQPLAAAPGQWQQNPIPPIPGQQRPATPVPAPGPRQIQFVEYDLPVSTTEFLPGLDATQIVGVVFGVALRSRDLRPAPDNAATLVSARQEALTQLVTMAKEAGAEAVVGVHFDTAKVSDLLVEVCAYGTAVLAVSHDELSQEQLTAPADESGDAPTTDAVPVTEPTSSIESQAEPTPPTYGGFVADQS